MDNGPITTLGEFNGPVPELCRELGEIHGLDGILLGSVSELTYYLNIRYGDCIPRNVFNQTFDKNREVLGTQVSGEYESCLDKQLISDGTVENLSI